MVSNVTMTSFVLQGVFVILFVLGLFFVLRKRERFSIRAVWVGALVFFVFSQVLEKILHLIVLQGKTEPHGLLANPLLFAVYGALAAGVFEEVGRYFGFRILLKHNRKRRDGIAYGLGHGGFEAIFIAVMASVQTLVYAVLINTGKFEQTLGGKTSPDVLAEIKSKLLNASLYEFFLGGLERVPALFIQIALSLIVLYAVRAKKKRVLVYAILLHALVDFTPALYQAYKGKISLWFVEILLLLIGIAAVWLINRSRKWQIWSADTHQID